jgi:hypothetical protein
MTASWKYVKRLIAVVLGLLGLVSWVALQTPAMMAASVSSCGTSNSITFAGESHDRAAYDGTGLARGRTARKLRGDIPPVSEANRDHARTGIKPISRDGGYNFHSAPRGAVRGLRIAHLGIRNAGLRSAVYSPPQSQSATILKANLKYRIRPNLVMAER